MQRQVLLDKLSEFLMVEQGGLQLYTVARERCTVPALKKRYEEFLQETAQHRQVLVQLIERLGGDPSYISPTARLAQVKAQSLLQTALAVDGLSAEEVQANDLENLLLAETKDHADWSLLSKLAEQADDPEVKQALQAVVAEVEAQEDEHLQWARETLSQLSLKAIMEGPAPPPERWQQVIAGPEPPIAEIHPNPLPPDDELLLEPARQAPWQPAPAVRAVAGQSKSSGGKRS
jgi:rubrerythrin